MASTLHLSTIDRARGGCFLPEYSKYLRSCFEQHFTSNINYCYQIWKKG
nr:hypothetical protein [Salmonella enterica]